MNVEIETVATQFLFWEFVSHFWYWFFAGQGRFHYQSYTNDSSVFCLNFLILEPRQCLEGLTVRVPV
jgi:hypothetical protein